MPWHDANRRESLWPAVPVAATAADSGNRKTDEGDCYQGEQGFTKVLRKRFGIVTRIDVASAQDECE